MSYRLRPIIPHKLVGKQSCWDTYTLDNIDLCRVRNIKLRKRMFCIIDKYLPYSLDIEYYEESQKGVYTGNIWKIPKEYNIVSFRYNSEYAAKEDIKLIHKRLDIIDNMFKYINKN